MLPLAPPTPPSASAVGTSAAQVPDDAPGMNPTHQDPDHG
jgi:hypothetical protein